MTTRMWSKQANTEQSLLGMIEGMAKVIGSHHLRIKQLEEAIEVKKQEQDVYGEAKKAESDDTED